MNTDEPLPRSASQDSATMPGEVTVPPRRRRSPDEDDGTEPLPKGETRQKIPQRTGAVVPEKTLPAQKVAGAEVFLRRSSEGLPLVDVPGYELLSVLGRGGMGIVYKARQTSLNRVVALKMILDTHGASAVDLARFRTEAEAVARLQHPHIIQIYEIGEINGRPFFSLEFVEGGALADRLDGAPMPPKDAARLVEALARAMHYAHERGIVHRDLKPANILLAASPNPGTDAVIPKVADFGLAKRLDVDRGQTRAGSVMGTPSYMPPEQAQGQNDRIGPLSDVYSLGAILYELLTGRPPFRGTTVMETVRQVTTEDPVPPLRLNPGTPRDLDTICLKCLQKDLVARYASAGALADDLVCYLEGRPVLARPVGTLGRAVRWSRRRPAAAALVAVSLAAGVTLLGLGIWHYAETQRYNTLLQGEIQRADDERDNALTQKAVADSERHRADGLRDLAEERGRRFRAAWYAADLGLIQAAWDQSQIARMRGLLERQRPEPGEPDVRGFEYHYYRRLCHAERQTLSGPQRDVTAVAFTPKEATLATASLEGVLLWDLKTSKSARLPLAGVRRLVITPDGRTLVVGGADRLVRFVDIAERKTRQTLKGHTGPILDVAVSPDGKWVASASGDFQVRLWGTTQGEPGPILRGHTGLVLAVAFSPDGKTVVSGSDDRTVRIWDATSGALLQTLSAHTGRVNSVAVAVDGTIVSGSADQTLRLWHPRKPGDAIILAGHTGPVHAVALSPDGRTIASASEDTSLRLWDLATAKEKDTRKGHTGPALAVAWSPDGTVLASGSADKTIKIWDGRNGPQRPPIREHAKPVFAVALNVKGTIVATASADGTAKLIDVARGQTLHTLTGHTGAVTAVTFAPSDRTIATAGLDGSVRLWDAETGAAGHVFATGGGAVNAIAVSPDGSTLAMAGVDRVILLWDLESHRLRGRLEGHTLGVNGLAFSPDGKTLASTGADRSVRLWEVASRTERALLTGHQEPCWTVAFSPDGRLLATGSEDRTVRLWETDSGRPVGVMVQGNSTVRGVAFSPDGRSLYAASGSVRIWDVEIRQERISLPGPGAWLGSVAISADSRFVAAGAYDGGVTLWDAGSQ